MVNQSILNNHGTKYFKDLQERLEKENEAFSLNVETMACSNPMKKGVPRIVLVDDQGNKVLDTLVKPETLSHGEKYVIKEGLKTKLCLLATDKGPSLETVISVIKYLVRDKPLCGYHLPIKLADLGLMKSRTEFAENLNLLQSKFATQSPAEEKILVQNENESIKGYKTENSQIPGKGFKVENLYDVAKIYNRDSSLVT